MGLFTLGDISFEKQVGTTFSIGTDILSKYNTYRYPIDLGDTSAGRGHFMLIRINTQEMSMYDYTFDTDPLSQAQKNNNRLFAATGATNIAGQAKTVINGVQRLGETISEALPQNFTEGAVSYAGALDRAVEGFSQATGLGAVYSGGKDFFSGAKQNFEDRLGSLSNTKGLRTTKKTLDAVALYMPDTLNYSDQQIYNTLNIGPELANKIGTGVSIADEFMSGRINAKQLGTNISPFIAQGITSILGKSLGADSFRGIFSATTGLVQNPRMELIYGSPSFRNFRFDFMFYPRSEKEGYQVQKIIERLRFHQAPEIMRGTAGYFMVPPSEFDIEFYYNGIRNPNIPNISTCVLTSIDVDYAPKGFHTFESPKDTTPKYGSTGMPFAIRMSLGFQETDIMTKLNYQSEENRIRLGE